MLSRTIREKIGESLRTVRAGQPLETVTTRSLPALQAYSEGYSTRGRRPAGERRSSTWSRPSRLIRTLEWPGDELPSSAATLNDPARAIAAIRRAYALRDQMPPLEAAHVRAYYRAVAEDDPRGAIVEYERLLASWPDETSAINNLAFHYARLGGCAKRTTCTGERSSFAPIRHCTWATSSNRPSSSTNLRLLTACSRRGRRSNRIRPRNQFFYRARLAVERGDFDGYYAIVDSSREEVPRTSGSTPRMFT